MVPSRTTLKPHLAAQQEHQRLSSLPSERRKKIPVLITPFCGNNQCFGSWYLLSESRLDFFHESGSGSGQKPNPNKDFINFSWYFLSKTRLEFSCTGILYAVCPLVLPRSLACWSSRRAGWYQGGSFDTRFTPWKMRIRFLARKSLV